MTTPTEPPRGPHFPPPSVAQRKSPPPPHPCTQAAVERLYQAFPPPPNSDWQALNAIVPGLQLMTQRHQLSDEVLCALLPACTALTSLNLAQNAFVTEQALKAISRLGLVSLNLASTQVHNLTPIVNQLEELENVNLFDTNIEPNSLEDFLRQHRGLTILTLPEKTPSGLFSKLTFEQLEEVTLVVGNSLTFDDFLQLLETAPALRRVHIQIRHPIGAEQLQKWVNLSIKLTQLDLIGDAKAISPELQQALVQLRESGVEVIVPSSFEAR